MAESRALVRGRPDHPAPRSRTADTGAGGGPPARSSGPRPDRSSDNWPGRPPGALPAPQLTVLLVVVLANYAAQVPYVLDLYGPHVSPSGTGLLMATLAWFLAGVAAQRRGGRTGHWLLLSFLLTEFLFYFHGQIFQMTNGYGMVYDLVHAHDTIVRWVFVVGDLNFVAAGFFAVYLAWHRHRSARA